MANKIIFGINTHINKFTKICNTVFSILKTCTINVVTTNSKSIIIKYFKFSNIYLLFFFFNNLLYIYLG